jgi:hypothetical protein
VFVKLTSRDPAAFRENVMGRFVSRDFLSGLMFIAFGFVALYWGTRLEMGTAVEMGPGYVPRMLAYTLVVLGGVISGSSLLVGSASVEALQWKPITLVTIGIFCFAFLFERAGLFPAAVALVLLASAANQHFKAAEVAGNMVVLCALCALVFKVGLGMHVPLLRGVW